MNTDHWLPSKHAEDEGVALADVTEHMGVVEQYEYVESRKMEGEKAFEAITQAFEQSVSRARINYLNEQRERLKQCLYDDDFHNVAEQIKREAQSLHMVPFSKL